MKALRRIKQSVHRLGPYLLIEMLLPGGTVLALLLWLAQHARLHSGSGPWRLPARRAPTTLVDAAR